MNIDASRVSLPLKSTSAGHSDLRAWLPCALILLLFATYFYLIAGINHAQQHTNAQDHAYYLHAIYKLSRFELPAFTLSNTFFTHTWGDHFEPSLALIAPLRYVFGIYVLVVVQILFILLGGLGVRAWVAARHPGGRLPDLAMAHFLGLWGIQAAVSFDFHMTVVGAMLVPWLLLTFERRQWGWFVPLLLFFWGCVETFGFWGMLIGLGLAWTHRRDRALLVAALGMVVLSLIYYVLVHKLVIPTFVKPGAAYAHYKFKAFGDSLGSAMAAMLSDPFRTIGALFTNHTGAPAGNGLKGQWYLMWFLAGGLLVWLRPAFFIMTFPLLAIKMLSDKAGAWGLSYHYSVVFMPFASMAAYDWLGARQGRKWAKVLAFAWPALVLAATLATVPWRGGQEEMSDCNLFNKNHWRQRYYPLHEAEKVMAMIPDDAVVTASNPFTPQLAFRDSISLYPMVLPKTEYALILRRGDTWPANPSVSEGELCTRFLDHVWWEILYDEPPVLLLRNRVVSRGKGREVGMKDNDRRLRPL